MNLQKKLTGNILNIKFGKKTSKVIINIHFSLGKKFDNSYYESQTVHFWYFRKSFERRIKSVETTASIEKDTDFFFF